MWDNIKTVFQSATEVIVSICRTAEKTVHLVENEVDNLDAEQKLRLNAITESRIKIVN
jgi:hypothetical protein